MTYTPLQTMTESINQSESTGTRPFEEKNVEVLSFSDYEPKFLDKETLKKLFILIFGIEPDLMSGVEVAARMTQDYWIVFEKYRLPDMAIAFTLPQEYFANLEQKAIFEGIEIRPKKDFARFFQQHFASNVYFPQIETIVVNPLADTDTRKDVAVKAFSLSHELVHGLQHKYYPGMSLARMEYEAYLTGSDVESLTTSPFFFLERIALSITPAQLTEEWLNYSEIKTSQPLKTST